jgi:putative transposase
VRILGEVRTAEPLPERLRDGRVVNYGDHWYVAIPETKKTKRCENQGRLVALDPGVRDFITWFSDRSAGHLGQQAVNRIVRLCRHLDRLISLRAKAKNRRKKRGYHDAIRRMQERIKFLIDELHWKCARFLVENFDVIILPPYETKDMVCKAKRKIRSKTARSMLTLSSYKFARRLEEKAFEFGKVVVRSSEAYTSKTVSWTGRVVNNLGGRKWIKDQGIVVNRDINGARGIFLRALSESTILAGGVKNLRQGAR